MVAMDRAFPYDAQTSNEADWRSLFAEHDGVVAGHLNELEVFADSTGQQVKVKTGSIWAGGQRGFIDSQKTVPLTANASGNPRYDLIVARNDFDSNDFEVVAIEGTPAVSPAPPALTSDSTQAERALAVIGPLANGYTTVGSSAVGDRRGFWSSSGLQYATNAARTFWRPTPFRYEQSILRSDGLRYRYNGSAWVLDAGLSQPMSFFGQHSSSSVSTTGVLAFSSIRIPVTYPVRLIVGLQGVFSLDNNNLYFRMLDATGAGMMPDQFFFNETFQQRAFAIRGSSVIAAGGTAGFDIINWVTGGTYAWLATFDMRLEPLPVLMAAADVLVAGNGDVYVADAADVVTPPGSAIGELDPAYRRLGLLTADAVVWNPTLTTRSYKPWGSLQPTKRRTTGRDGTVTFELLEFVEDVLLTALVGGAYLATSASTSIYLPTIDDDPPILSVVIDCVDEQSAGTVYKRLFFPAAQVVSSPEIPFNGERATGFPVTLACNASPATIFPYAILHGFVPRPPRPPRPNRFMRAYLIAGEGPPGSDADELGFAGVVYVDVVSGDVYEATSGFTATPSPARSYLGIVHGYPDDGDGDVGDSVWDIDDSTLPVYGKE